MVVVVVVVVVAEEGVVSGVVKGGEVWGDKVISLCVAGGKVEAEKKVGSVFSSGVVAAACVEVAGVEAVVGCIGAVVRAAWVVMVVVEDGMVVEGSVAVFDVCVLIRAAVLLGMICICSFTSWVEVFIMVVGAFLVVNAGTTSFVAVVLDGWVGVIVVLVVSLAVMLKEVPDGSAFKGIGR